MSPFQIDSLKTHKFFTNDTSIGKHLLLNIYDNNPNTKVLEINAVTIYGNFTGRKSLIFLKINYLLINFCILFLLMFFEFPFLGRKNKNYLINSIKKNNEEIELKSNLTDGIYFKNGITSFVELNSVDFLTIHVPGIEISLLCVTGNVIIYYFSVILILLIAVLEINSKMIIKLKNPIVNPSVKKEFNDNFLNSQTLCWEDIDEYTVRIIITSESLIKITEIDIAGKSKFRKFLNNF